MLLLLTKIFCEVIESCSIPNSKDIVIKKYYRDNCPHCQRIAPLIGMIDNKLNEHGIKTDVASIECSRCDCSIVDAVPTIVVMKNSVEIGRFRGYRDYEEIAKFFSKVLKVDQKVFEKTAREKQPEVRLLKESDFNRGFKGPNVILFFDSKKDKRRELFVELNQFFEGRVLFNEAYASDVPLILHRYNITTFPQILAVYDGVSTFFHGEMNLVNLIDFVENLIAPSFVDVSKPKFDEMVADLQKGDPLFVVLYNDLRKANDKFLQLTHSLRAKSKFVKSNDSLLFIASGLKPSAERPIILTVYRNNMFHAYSGNIDDEDELMAWIYNAHYPLLMKISQKTFSSVFFGFKPVLLLITKGEFLIERFEKYVEKAHGLLPYTSFLHATVDFDEFFVVLKSSLKNLRVPALLVYDPMEKKFYGENILLNEETLSFVASRVSMKYLDNTLPFYGVRSYKKQYFAIAVFILGLFALGYRRTGKTLKLQ